MDTTADERPQPSMQENNEIAIAGRSPVHVVYGGADRFSSATPAKFGTIALKTLAEYAPGTVEFAAAMGLNADNEGPPTLDPSRVYELSLEKLRSEPIEDFRIDFEDGYGFRSDDEEDGHARSAAVELARAYLDNTITPFCGFRIKSFAEETEFRAERTLSLFLEELLNTTAGVLPHNFVVTLP
ncbi:MAG TPA: hypothetical protein VHL50_05215, partial [Pyrinomonadaceae bacterium]|nr:hypothetical protein [Pyrinomonadaceae bacterium]